jgi:hemerythrin superfamily protein
MADATIYDELKADHDRHRALLAKIAEGGDDRAALFEQFRIDVTAHAAAEEQTLYATMLADPDLQEEARHSVSEHKEIEDMLTELYELGPDSDAFDEKFAAMRTRYDHHILEEEEEMFPEADDALDDQVEATLARRFEERKEAEVAKAEATDPTEKEHRD